MSGGSGPYRYISVIIPVYTVDHRLELCLAALARQTVPAESFEILLVLNGPDPELGIHVPDGLVVRKYHEPRGGSYQARNVGIRHAEHDVLAFTDSDCIPHEEWLEAGRVALESGFDIIGGRIDLSFGDPDALTIAELFESFTAFRQEKNTRKGFSVTANMFSRSTVFEAVGPFRADLFSGGDVDWCRRAVSAGARLGYNSAAIVVHPARTAVPQLAEKARRVVHGMFAREITTRSRLSAFSRIVIRLALSHAAFARSVTFARTSSLTFSARMKLAAVQSYVQSIKLWELIRVCVGQAPERR